MKGGFYLLHSVNSEPVLHAVSSRGGKLSFLRDIWLLFQDNLQGQNECCLAYVNLQLHRCIDLQVLRLFLGHTERHFV